MSFKLPTKEDHNNRWRVYHRGKGVDGHIYAVQGHLCIRDSPKNGWDHPKCESEMGKIHFPIFCHWLLHPYLCSIMKWLIMRIGAKMWKKVDCKTSLTGWKWWNSFSHSHFLPLLPHSYLCSTVDIGYSRNRILWLLPWNKYWILWLIVSLYLVFWYNKMYRLVSNIGYCDRFGHVPR